MITPGDLVIFALYLEGFLYGNIPVLCALTCTLSNEVQLFLDLGVYSGIFAIYLRCPSNESRTRTANVVFYVICLLYVLCSASFAIDLLKITLQVSNNPIFKNIVLTISRAVDYQFNFASTSNSS